MNLIDQLLAKPKRITYEQSLGGWNWKIEEFHDERGWRKVDSGWERYYSDAELNIETYVSPAP